MRMQLNLGNLMQNRAFLSPDQEAGVGDGYRYSYEQVNKRANQVAELLAASGIRAGDRVAVLGKNDEWVTTCLFGAAKIGVVTVLLNWRLHARELDFILNDCTAATLIYDQQFAEPVEQIRADLPCRVYICRNSSSADPDFEAELQKMPGNEPEKTGSGGDPALLMYTSGTTGKPKGVTLSHDNLFWASIGLSHTIDWRSKSRFLSVAPFFISADWPRFWPTCTGAAPPYTCQILIPKRYGRSLPMRRSIF
jgi:acyl-CoA synthetase (AMP-forming)/AMP-acid ligase II